MRRALLVLAALCALALVPSRALAGPTKLFSGLGGDFGAFYCSGAAVTQHANPYLVEPLRACEERVQPNPDRTAGVVTPSPLPGYDLALFAALAHLPYGLAKLFWYAVLLGSLALATLCLARLTRFPPLLILVVLLPVDGFLNLSFGQLPPVIVAAVSLAALLIERERYVAAAVVASVSMLEPHIGAPACLAMFLFFPGCRRAFGAIAVALAALSLATGGLAQNIAYFKTHLPEQAWGELVAADQFSLSAVLHLLHFPDKLALAIGTLSYVVMAGAGIWLGRYAARALESPAFVVLIPAAAALFAGTYVHDVQFAAALPAALLFCAKERKRIAPWIVLGLLLVPWFTYGTGGHTIGLAIRLLCALAIAWLTLLATRDMPLRTRQIATGSAVAGFIVLLGFCAVLPHRTAGDPSAIPPDFLKPEASAQDNWAAYLRVTPSLSRTSLREEFEKVPFWLGVLGILLLAADAPIPEVTGSGGRSLARDARTPARALRDDAPVAT